MGDFEIFIDMNGYECFHQPTPGKLGPGILWRHLERGWEAFFDAPDATAQFHAPDRHSFPCESRLNVALILYGRIIDEAILIVYADLSDDVDTSISTVTTRERMLEILSETLGQELMDEIYEKCRGSITHYASGAPFEG